MLPRGMKITEAPGREPVPKMRVIVVWAGLDQRPEPIPGQDVVAGVKVRSGERLADAARGRLRSGSVAEHLGRGGGVAAVEQTQPTPVPVVDLSVRTAARLVRMVGVVPILPHGVVPLARRPLPLRIRCPA